MKPPLLLYSTSTWLAYSVAEQYYGGIHYAWCSPVYDARAAEVHINIPPSSSPAAIYRWLLDDTRNGDRHSESIKRNTAGIQRGAEARRIQEIVEGLALAEFRDFRPVLYLIPYQQVLGIASRVPVADRAHPMSIEYVVESLPGSCFDMIELTL
jgi:hypothetical protein